MKKLLAIITAFVLGLSVVSTSPAFATAGPATTFGVETAILKDCGGKEAGSGEGITCVVQLVVDILSIGVGIFGVIGIAITGIQYLTAGGSEEQTRKAKRRLFEIIIGLAVYAVAAALLSWLLPD